MACCLPCSASSARLSAVCAGPSPFCCLYLGNVTLFNQCNKLFFTEMVYCYYANMSSRRQRWFSCSRSLYFEVMSVEWSDLPWLEASRPALFLAVILIKAPDAVASTSSNVMVPSLTSNLSISILPSFNISTLYDMLRQFASFDPCMVKMNGTSCNSSGSTTSWMSKRIAYFGLVWSILPSYHCIS